MVKEKSTHFIKEGDWSLLKWLHPFFLFANFVERNLSIDQIKSFVVKIIKTILK